MTIKIMTYNIMHGLDFLLWQEQDKKVINLDKIGDIIKNINPDIIGLNEVYNSSDMNQVQYLAERLGYSYYYFGRSITLKNGTFYGNAIISRYPIAYFKVNEIPAPEFRALNRHYEARTILEATLIIGDLSVKCFVAHFGLSGDERRMATDTLLRLAKENKDMPLIAMGDFNMDDDPLLVEIKSFFDDCNLCKKENTFCLRGKECKIDHIFTKNFRIVKEGAERYVASDHYPLWMTIERK